jgi:hypothetical protein
VPRVLIVNGSLGGNTGNTAELLALAEDHLSEWADIEHLELVRGPSLERVLTAAEGADAFLFGTGTYWDSWGSPLQLFFENTAHTEGSAYWAGKPTGAIVTAHAVGAKSVLSRLLGILNAYGMLIPPFAGMAYTWVNEVAGPVAPDHLRNELWSPDDVQVIAHNLSQAVQGGREWSCWPTNEGRSGEKWLHVYSSRGDES